MNLRDRTGRVWTLPIAAAICLIPASARAESDFESVPSPSEYKAASLSADEYQKSGAPDALASWTPAQALIAANVLRQVTEARNLSLPKQGGPGDAFFRRFLDPTLRAFTTDSKRSMGERGTAVSQLVQANAQLVKLYVGAMVQGERVESETLLLVGSTLETADAALAYAEEYQLSLPFEDPKKLPKVAGLEQLQNGTYQSYVGALAALEDKGRYHLEDRRRLLDTVVRSTPGITKRLPPESTILLGQEVCRVAGSESAADLGDALKRICTALTPPGTAKPAPEAAESR